MSRKRKKEQIDGYCGLPFEGSSVFRVPDINTIHESIGKKQFLSNIIFGSCSTAVAYIISKTDHDEALKDEAVQLFSSTIHYTGPKENFVIYPAPDWNLLKRWKKRRSKKEEEEEEKTYGDSEYWKKCDYTLCQEYCTQDLSSYPLKEIRKWNSNVDSANPPSQVNHWRSWACDTSNFGVVVFFKKKDKVITRPLEEEEVKELCGPRSIVGGAGCDVSEGWKIFTKDKRFNNRKKILDEEETEKKRKRKKKKISKEDG